MNNKAFAAGLAAILTASVSPATAQTTEWGRGLIPGDSVRVHVHLLGMTVVHDRFVSWSDSLMTLRDTALARGSVRSVDVWRKRNAGETVAISLAYGLGAGLLDYGVNRDLGPSIAVGGATAVLGYILERPGKWVYARSNLYGGRIRPSRTFVGIGLAVLGVVIVVHEVRR